MVNSRPVKGYLAEVTKDFGGQLCTCSDYVGKPKDKLAKDCVFCVLDEALRRAVADDILNYFCQRMAELEKGGS